ncbi:transcriptional regulator [Thermococcus profundus]|uniref:Transcriptional regulator n=1 Tax=Thermococcus profundus TaxID=49899 RepID=A0A2Z2MC70_THEPR|nr:winged helix-turn-helix transcriptional regulator [Thermococcus profundus]ASJ03446.1 transcriptional regulator [Thermococcus profundus]
MSRAMALTIILVSFMLFTGIPVSARSVDSIALTVYEDGYVLVNETLSTANYSVAVDIPLLGRNVEGLVATDGEGNLLPIEVNSGNVTVYFGNASTVQLSYYTPDLTSKEGAVWTVSLDSPIPVEITLPSDAVIVDLSDIPLEIRGSTILMPAGNVSVSYVIPIQVTTTTTSSSEGQGSTRTSSSSTSSTSSTTSTALPGGDNGSSTSSSSSTSPSTTTTSTTTPASSTGTTTTTPGGGAGGSSAGKLAGVLVGILVIVGVAYLYLRRRSAPEKAESGSNSDALQRFREKIDSLPDLNDDERGALIYLMENGGKAPQSKVRDALGLPKTTAWRMFKRLEERGLVRVYKLGRENWVELVLD